MKRVFIVHGWDGNPKEPLIVWLKGELDKRDFNVITPKMPNPSKPKIKPWVSHLNKIVKNPDRDTYFIGHSVGCQAVLRYIESLKNSKKVGGLVLVAPWMHLDEKTIEEEGEEVKKIAKPWMKTPIIWKNILSKVSKKSVCIFSDNDPYVPLSDVNLFKKNIKAETIIEHNKYHFDSYHKIRKVQSILNLD